jgi:two-component system, sporulation sensor kinase D
LNIYQRKIIWKRVLFVIALLIVLCSLWYSSIIVNKISNEERKKVELWAGAIQKKANLVNYTDKLFDKLRTEERKKVELYVEAIKRLTNPNPNFNPDYTFLSKVVTSNTTVPVILADQEKNIKTSRNLDSLISQSQDSLLRQLVIMASKYEPIEISYYGDQKDFVYYKDSKLFSELQKVFADLQQSFITEVVSNAVSVPVIYTDSSKSKILAFGNIDSSLVQKPDVSGLIAKMQSENLPIKIELQEGHFNYIFYQDSWILTQLKYYPLIQFGVIGVFMLIAYFLFSSSRRAEQNQVWVGMAKETAHQLGTPLSSLMAWLELIRARGNDQAMVVELEKDINRLGTITERFSKIGSTPVLTPHNMVEVIQHAINYIKSRSSQKIKFSVNYAETETFLAQVNIPLFEWVIENLCKNAIDAMEGVGSLTLDIGEMGNQIFIDVSDTGKGISTSKKKTVFEPGFTTKKRGWGLGLSLSKRIIEDYHSGKIFVRETKVGEGTTFRILLNK